MHTIRQRFSTVTEKHRVCISGPTRIHCGLINESGYAGRVDGGIGFCLADPTWEIEISRSEMGNSVTGLTAPQKTAVLVALERLKENIPYSGVLVRVISSVPLHVGLGSKTSLLMAVARGVCQLFGLNIPAVDLATIIQRGGTSGIGVHGSMLGGFLWDGGRRFPEEKACFGPSSLKLARPPNLLCRTQVSWLHVVHFRFANVGLHGDDEVRLFRDNCPTPHHDTLANMRIISEMVWPAIPKRDEALLQKGISEMQEVGLKRAEWSHQQQITKDFYGFWKSSKMRWAVGLSSMGPTLYALTSEPGAVCDAVRMFTREPVHLTVTAIANSGVIVNGRKTEYA